FTLAGGTVTGTVDGGAGTDTLTGNDTANAWTVTTLGTGTVTGTGGFANMENLTGGALADAFILGSTVAGTVDGGAGTDSLTANNAANTWAVTTAGGGTVTGTGGFANMENLTGGTLADAFTLAGGTVTGTVDGGAGTDTLTAGNGANTWAVTALGGGTVTGSGGFANMENLTGGALADAFTLAGGTIAGTVDGGAGTDTLTAANTANTWTVTAPGGGTVTGTGGFANMESLTGGTADDAFTFGAAGAVSGTLDGGAHVTGDSVNYGAVTAPVSVVLGGNVLNVEAVTGDGVNDALTGPNAASTWTVTGPGAGSVGAVAFSGFNRLTGGTLADAFTLGGGTVTGTVDGGVGTDTLTAGNVANTWAVTTAGGGTVTGTGGFSGFENLAGGGGDDAFTLVTGGSLAGTVSGGAGTDTLTGRGVANLWSVSGNGAGSVGGVGGFSGMENLTGGGLDDVFTFGAGGALSGVLNGALGVDSVSYAAVTAPVAVTLGGNVLNVEMVTGDGVGDALTGPDQATAWNITTANGGSVGGVAFSGFGTLSGGAGDDVFTLGTSGSLSGVVGGGLGGDTLNAGNASHAWTVTGAGAGTVGGTGGFAGMERLVGGGGDDAFVFGAAGSLAGGIDGGAHVSGDSVDYSAVTAPVSASLAGNALRIESLTGDGANDTLQGTDATSTWSLTGPGSGNVGGVAFSGFANLAGGAADDSFVFASAASIAGGIDGGAHVSGDRVDYSALADPMTVVMGQDASNVEVIVGNGVNHALTGGPSGSAWVIGGPGTGTVDGAAFSGFVSFAGGVGNDSFTLAGGSVAGTLDGGLGADTLAADNVANTWAITGAGSGTVQGVGAFAGMENLTGGTQGDTFTLAGGGVTGTIAGGAGSDHLIAADTANTWTVTGAGSGTVTGSGGFSGMERLTGGAQDDTVTFGASGSLPGLFDAGAQAVADSVNVSAVTAPVAVVVGSNFGGFESYTGDGVNDGLFVGDGANTWTLTGAGAGGVGGIAFSGIAHLNGGAGADTFNLAGGGVTGVIAGGGGSDVLRGGDVTRVWTLTGPGGGALSGTGGFTGMEQLVGGAGDDAFTLAGGTLSGTLDGGTGNDTLMGNNVATTWNVTSLGGGTVTGIGGFSGMENLTGGNGADSFLVAAAAGQGVTGLIQGGAGNDLLGIGYTGAATRTVTFYGGTGTDTAVLNGGGAGFTGTFGPGAVADEVRLVYNAGSQSQTLVARGVEVLTDQVAAASLSVAGSSAGDTGRLAAGGAAGANPVRVEIGTRVIELANKNSLTVDLGGGADSLSVAGALSLPGTLTIAAETITGVSGAALGASTLALVGPAGVGTAAQPLELAVGTLRIEHGTQTVYLREADALVLDASQVAGDINLAAGGGVTAHAGLTIGGNLNLTVASGADVILDGAGNLFSGAVAIQGGAVNNLTLVDGDALALAGASVGGDLSVSAAGAVTQTGALLVTGATTIGAGAGGILLTHAGNRFGGAVTLANSGANNVALGASAPLLLGGLTLGSGSLTLSAPGISQNAPLVMAAGAPSVTLSGGSGTVRLDQAGNVLVGRLTASGAGATIVTGASLRVATVSTTGAVSLTSGGALILGRVDSGTGTITLSTVGDVLTEDIGVHLEGGGVTLAAPGRQVGSVAIPLALNLSGAIRFDAAQVYFRGISGAVSGTPGTVLINTDGAVASVGLGKLSVPHPRRTIDPVRLQTTPLLFGLHRGGLTLPPDDADY
ncbi:MAG: hypothetical protein HZA24_05010, partial [Nitrospirae bacterium]|nr:hypothetical protein [Nitrospirota bacterium]